MDFNFHTHTWRCGHATGTEREYIEAAIAVGVKEMGFSDHAPWIAPDLGKDMSSVVPYAKVEDYVNTVKACREEYRDRIAIHLGFEAEYDPVDPEDPDSPATGVSVMGAILAVALVPASAAAAFKLRRKKEDEE